LEVIGVPSSRTGRGRPFVHRLGELGRVLGPLSCEAANLGVVVDSFQLYAAAEDVQAGLEWGVRRVGWVHVADLPESAPADRAAVRDHDRGLPGEHGAVETRLVLEQLSEAGYDGPVTAEPMAVCRSLKGLAPEQAARRIATALGAVWPGETGTRR